MKRMSWKTTLCGIIGLVLMGASKTPGCPLWACHLLELLGGAAPSVGLLFARDNNRTSEDVGAKVKNNGTVTPIIMAYSTTPPPDQPPARPGDPTKPPPAYPGDGPEPMPLPPKPTPPGTIPTEPAP